MDDREKRVGGIILIAAIVLLLLWLAGRGKRRPDPLPEA